MEKTKSEVLGKDLERLQTSLSAYELKLLNNDKSSSIKAMVEYYREQARLVRMFIMGLIRIVQVDGTVPVPAPVPEVTPPVLLEEVAPATPEPVATEATPEPVPVQVPV